MSGSEEKTPRKGRIRPGKAIAVLLIAIIVYCCIYSLVVKAVKGESLPMPLGFGVGVILTGSMEPAYSANDVIIVTRAKTYSVGEVIVYQTGGTPVVHRLVSIDEKSGIAVAQGDANNAPDEPFTISRIKGKVAFAVPYVGAVARFIKTVPGLVMILVFIFTLFYLSLRSKPEESEKESAEDKLEREIKELRELLEAKAAENKPDETPESK